MMKKKSLLLLSLSAMCIIFLATASTNSLNQKGSVPGLAKKARATGRYAHLERKIWSELYRSKSSARLQQFKIALNKESLKKQKNEKRARAKQRALLMKSLS